jgi:predicted Zn-dependent peptidase
MPRRSFHLVALLLALTLPPFVATQEPGRIDYQTYALQNGLRVVLAPDPSVQVVTVNVWYDVGSRNERASRTGFAHLFEHMMFQGSANVEKGAHFQLIERAGGNLNGSTSADRTNYYQTLPSNRLNLGLWLEADRMRSLAVTEENFNNQREAVKEERRMRIDNQPYVGAFQQALVSVYDPATCFAYAHEPIGSMDDLNAATTADVQEFFDLYYVPNNAVLTVTGDFAVAEARSLITQYFGAIPRGRQPPPVACEQPFNTGERRMRIPDAKASLPAVAVLYRTPPATSAEIPALDLLATILGQGESSRLNQALVRETRAAVAAQAVSIGDQRGPGAMAVIGIANQGVSADSVEKLLRAVIARVDAEGVTAEELTKAKNLYRSQQIGSRQTTMGVAEALQTAGMIQGDLESVNTRFAAYMRVTVEDIRRAVRQYLNANNSVIVLIAPPEVTP